METGFARRSDLPRLREIWYACFGGPEAYLDFYYGRRFSTRETLVVRDHDVPAAMLTLMNVSVNDKKGAYVYAVATHPDYQGRGLQHMLDQFSLEVLKKRNAAFRCLVPATPELFGLYEKFGYKACFPLWRKEIDRSSEPEDFYPLHFSLCSFNDFHALRRDYLKTFDFPVVHPPRELKYIYEELNNFEGAVAFFTSGGLPCYAAYNCIQGKIFLRETNSRNPEDTARSLMSMHSAGSAVITSGHSFPGAVRVPYGMGQTLNSEEGMPENGYMSLMLD